MLFLLIRVLRIFAKESLDQFVSFINSATSYLEPGISDNSVDLRRLGDIPGNLITIADCLLSGVLERRCSRTPELSVSSSYIKCIFCRLSERYVGRPLTIMLVVEYVAFNLRSMKPSMFKATKAGGAWQGGDDTGTILCSLLLALSPAVARLPAGYCARCCSLDSCC